MKEGKKIKIIIWLIVILLILIGVFGLYSQKLNRLANIIPDYELGIDLKGAREFKLKVDTTEEEKEVFLDENNNIAGIVINEENKEVPGYKVKKETIKKNPEEVLNSKKFGETRKILEKRLEKIGISDYEVRMNLENGDLVIRTAQNEKTTTDYSMLLTQGKIEVLDAQTGIVLLSDNELKKVSVMTNQSQASSYDIYLQLEFDEKGKEKLTEISKKYIEYTQDGEEESKIDYISIQLDGTELRKTYFSEEWTNNILYIPIYQGISDAKELEEAYSSIKKVADIINTGKLPIVYSLENDSFIKSEITKEQIQLFEYIVYGILVVTAVILTIWKGKEGFKSGVLNFGLVMLYSIVLKVLKISLTFSGICGIFLIIILNMILYIKLLKNKNKFYTILKKYNIETIPVMIIAIIFTLTGNKIEIISLGTTLFWGIILSNAFNLLITKNIMDNKGESNEE